MVPTLAVTAVRSCTTPLIAVVLAATPAAFAWTVGLLVTSVWMITLFPSEMPYTCTPLIDPSLLLTSVQALAASSSFFCISSQDRTVLDSSHLFLSGLCGYSVILTILCFSFTLFPSSTIQTVSPRPKDRMS